jgi:hypothetical protein
MLPAHKRTDVAELIQVRDVVNTDPPRNTKARTFVRASELELPREAGASNMKYTTYHAQ